MLDVPLVRSVRWWPVGLLVALALLPVALALLAVGCRSEEPLGLADAALSHRDVPEGWLPADLEDESSDELWDVLPQLLTSNAEAHLLLRAFESEDGLRGAATIVIQTDERAAIPRTTTGDEQVLAPLTRLLERQDDLLGPSVRGGDPSAYFAASDAPLPGSLRSRLVRLLDDGRLFSDSAIFSFGRVLVVVTVWYPEEEGPFRDVADLAGDVESRLRSYLGTS